jgi:NAD(P)H-hydrate repair Nnr-like enzyme with NAD(P)H-hydrate dehydratase domain
MAKGGSGDVLTGIIGGLLATGVSPLDAARLGVYLHGLAGDIAVKTRNETCLSAGDLIETLQYAFETI